MTTRQAVVTAVIPCFNQGQFLAECVGSLRAQTDPNWRAIVVNDCSTDGVTAALCDAQADDRVTVVHLPHNHGRSLARNVGIGMAQTEAILSLDADDALDPRHFAATVPELLRDPAVGVVYTDYALFGTKSGRWKGRPFDAARLYTDQYIRAGSLFRKSAWAQTGGYKEAFSIGNEDWDLWLTLVEAGWRGQWVAQPLYRYRLHAQSWTNSGDMHGADRGYRSLLLLLDHHKDGFARNGATGTFLAWATRREAERLTQCGQHAQAKALWRRVRAARPWDFVAWWRGR